MTPIQILNRFKNPKAFQNAFMNFLEKNNLVFQQSKTLAELVRYDQKSIGGASSVQFFAGGFDQGNTNLLNQFTPPESEHMVIWGVRVLSTDDVQDPVYNTTWVEGNSNEPTIQNAKLSIKNNSVEVLRDYPLADFIPDLTTKDVGLITLSEPIVWAGQSNCIATLKTADGTSTFTADTGIRIEYIGIGLI
jgi:hypothetical protein